jgi:hypothetical protein
MKIIGLLLIAICSAYGLNAQQKFNGIDVNMGNLYRLSDAKSRSISPENFNGEKGKGGMATTGTGSGPSRDLGLGFDLKKILK